MTSIHSLAVFAVFGLVSGSAAQNIQASLVAVQPLTITEVGIGQASHPAGPLTNALLTLGQSSVRVDLTQTALGHSLECKLLTVAPHPQHFHVANTDLQLSLTASVPTRATLRIFTHCQEDGTGSVNVNVPGHGSIAFVNGSGIGERHFDHFEVVLTNTPLSISLIQSTGGPPPGLSSIVLDVDEWSSLASPAAQGCGGIFYHDQSGQLILQSDHFLDLVDNTISSSSGTMRARAIGQWSSFVFSMQSTMVPVQLPAPFVSTCPLLAAAPVLLGGIETDNYFGPTAWELQLPLLPPGLTFYMQHACAKVPIWPGNVLWNTSNVVRVDT